MPPAHPRVCGENYLHMNSMPQANGSSPRVRGKLAPRTRHRHPTRLIPACAGKTQDEERLVGVDAAHPRVCGENSSSMVSVASVAGSSPRVRGKRLRRLARHSRGRLIPACAGKTAPVPTLMVSSTAHPRVCGENILMDINKLLLGGSSPRVRGKPWGYPPGTLVTWLIPACAGKTSSELRRSRPTAAHPRVCGENLVLGGRAWGWVGSSPRVRGKLGLGAQRPPRRGSSPRVRGKPGRAPAHPVRLGLIPACAGKTGRRGDALRAYPAHPRVCGENIGAHIETISGAGSSPRVRGKRMGEVAGVLSGRLIPACAGKTSRTPSTASRTPAHPRACGENSKRKAVAFGRSGSSPRVRGKH